MAYNNEILGYMHEHELNVLEQFAYTVPKGGKIVEVGSFLGRSSVCFALSAPEATVYCVDEFSDKDWICHININSDGDNYIEAKCPIFGQAYNTKKEFLKNTQHIPNIVQIQGYSPHQIIYENGEIDLFFLDAGHQNPNDWDNICYWVPLVKSGGIICGHDYSHEFPNVIQNVHRLETILGKQAKLHFSTSIWSFQLDFKIERHMLEALKNRG